MDLIESINSSAFLRTAATAALALLIAQGIPRAIKTVYDWTSAALFGSLSGSKRRIAVFFAAMSVLWVFVVVGLLYAPLTELAPRILPFPDGAVRWVMTLIELWLLLLLPLTIGAIEAYFSKGSWLYRASLLPRAFVHTVGIALAMVTLVPWIVARVIIVRVRRQREERISVDIDPERYESVTGALVATVNGAGFPGKVVELPAAVRLARWFLHRLGPPLLRPDAEYEARRIRGDVYVMLVFDGLIDVIAERQVASQVRQALIGKLPPDGLWLTRSEEAQALERRIRSGRDIDDIPQRISELDATLEEWRILSWEYTQVLVAKDLRAAATPVEGG